MTEFTAINLSDLEAGDPFTATQAQAMFNNPKAISEMDSTATAAGVYAPGAWYAHDDSTGVIYDFAVDGVQLDVVTPDFVDGWEYRILLEGISSDSGAAGVDAQIALYAETSAAWSGNVDVQVGTANPSLKRYGYIDIPTPRMVSNVHVVFAAISNWSVGFNQAAGGEAKSGYVGRATSQKILKARLGFSIGSIDSGKVIMLKSAISFTR